MNGPDKKGERIAKFLARAGVASRREIERMILEGRIQVEGKTLAHPAFLVTRNQRITVDGRPVKKAEAPRLWRYHKPAGLIVAARDPHGRPTVFEDLPKSMPRVISIGRLDLNSEGLLLLTNDGALARHLETSDLPRHYRVRVHGTALDEKNLAGLKKGITLEGIRYKPVTIIPEHSKGTNKWLGVMLTEGKNREIRKIMEHLGLRVNRLVRTGFGPFQLARLEKGKAEEIPASYLRQSLPEFFKGSK